MANQYFRRHLQRAAYTIVYIRQGLGETRFCHQTIPHTYSPNSIIIKTKENQGSLLINREPWENGPTCPAYYIL